ncbi:MAG TPA: YoaK family protein [Terriglobales bacterium]|jgi:uncharacterized membrane protein YoaK (UPF0700 family)
MSRGRPRPPAGDYGRALAAIWLGLIAGFVDALGYLLLTQVYTSHMTGNTASLARDVAGHRWFGVLRHGWPIAAFMAGLMIGAWLTEIGRRRHWHFRLSLVLALELIVLAAMLVLPPVTPATLAWPVAIPALAMGMQTVTITRIGEERVYSTYVTGTLSKLAEALIGYLFWLHDRPASIAPRARWREAARHRLLWQAILTGGLWLAFLMGAVLGVFGEARFGSNAVVAPIAALAALIAVDLHRPITPAT